MTTYTLHISTFVIDFNPRAHISVKHFFTFQLASILKMFFSYENDVLCTFF